MWKVRFSTFTRIDSIQSMLFQNGFCTNSYFVSGTNFFFSFRHAPNYALSITLVPFYIYLPVSNITAREIKMSKKTIAVNDTRKLTKRRPVLLPVKLVTSTNIAANRFSLAPLLFTCYKIIQKRLRES